MTKYLLSDGTFTDKLQVYIQDYINLVFETENYSVPTSPLGFFHNLENVEKDAINTTIQLRINSTLAELSKAINRQCIYVGSSFGDDNQLYIRINVEKEDEYQIPLNIQV